MSTFAIALVLLSATFHATWNLMAKRAKGGPVFLWLFAVVSFIIYTPITLIFVLINQPVIGPPQVLFMIISAFLHLAYFLLLSQGYRVGDLSLVYPLARGTGPMLSVVGAILLLGEHPSTVALIGAALIGLGIFALTGDPRKLRQHNALPGVIFALLTGVTIAAYTLSDKYAVATILVAPVVLDWGSNTGRILLLTPVALRRWDEVRDQWRDYRKEVIFVAVLSPLAYIMVLFAMSFSPVSYVAPMREISTLIGTFMGVRLLSEGHLRRRLGAASIMALGVIALGLG